MILFVVYMEKPLSVAVSVVISHGKIPLINRNRGEYVGSWGLPGGKIELTEHPREAAIREIEEEAGLETRFESHRGVVSVHLVENERVKSHFLLHICELSTGRMQTESGAEGEIRWFDRDEIGAMENDIVPSDYMILEQIIFERTTGRNSGYYDCVVEVTGNEYTLHRFE